MGKNTAIARLRPAHGVPTDRARSEGHAQNWRLLGRNFEGYIHEELAAFALMPPAVVIYPGSNLRSVEYFLTYSVPGRELLSTAHRTRIDFDNIHAPMPAGVPDRHSRHENLPASRTGIA